MGLWLEFREDGKLTAARFRDGKVEIEARSDLLTLTVDEARKLAKYSGHLPAERRDWTLRVKGSLEDMSEVPFPDGLLAGSPDGI